jgi:hypothetical protein
VVSLRRDEENDIFTPSAGFALTHKIKKITTTKITPKTLAV